VCGLAGFSKMFRHTNPCFPFLIVVHLHEHTVATRT